MLTNHAWRVRYRASLRDFDILTARCLNRPPGGAPHHPYLYRESLLVAHRHLGDASRDNIAPTPYYLYFLSTERHLPTA